MNVYLTQSLFRCTPLAAILAAVVSLPSPAFAAATIPDGSVIHAQLTSPDINSKNAQVGQRFTLGVVAPYPNGNATFSGATINGHVAAVRSAGQGRAPILQLAVDSIELPNGERGALSAHITNMDVTAENTTARKAVGTGVGTLVGSQTIGRIIGGTAGAVIGSLGGAAAGYAYGANDKANISLVRGANMTLTTTAGTTVRMR